MIEFCSERRMFIAIGLLGGVTLLILILEGRWTWSATAARGTIAPVLSSASNSSCWLREEFVILEDCHPCSAFEIASKSIKECITTKYKEVIKCKTSGRAVRSCSKVVWLEERNFWVFEAVAVSGALLSSLAVYIRQRELDRRMIRRLQAQLSSCA